MLGLGMMKLLKKVLKTLLIWILKSVSRSIRNTMHKKGIKFAPVVELAKLKFTYIIVVK